MDNKLTLVEMNWKPSLNSGAVIKAEPVTVPAPNADALKLDPRKIAGALVKRDYVNQLLGF